MDAAIERLSALKLQEKSYEASSPRSENQHQQQHHHHAHPSSNGSSSSNQQLQLEMQQMRLEFERRVREQEQQQQLWQHEILALRARLEATEQQNHTLRQAVAESEPLKLQLHDQQLVIDELQSQVKQLRLTNYRLQFVVQQNEPRGHSAFLPPRPPDIF